MKKTRLLIIDDSTRADIKRVMTYAHNNPMTMDMMLDVFNNPSLAPGNDVNHTVIISDGFKVVYTVDEQVLGKMKHLSISIGGRPDILPSIEAVNIIMKEFDFKNIIGDLGIYLHLEKIGEDRKAINVMELLEEN